MNNLVIIKSMIRISRIIKEFKEIRCKSMSLLSKVSYTIIEGEISNTIDNELKRNINSCLYQEKYLHESVDRMCKCLDGFDISKMDSVNYISSSDIKNGYIDICKNNKLKASINLKTGNIEYIESVET